MTSRKHTQAEVLVLLLTCATIQQVVLLHQHSSCDKVTKVPQTLVTPSQQLQALTLVNRDMHTH